MLRSGLILSLSLLFTHSTLAGFGTENVSDGASFSEVTKIIQAPAPDSRWFVLEKSGRISTFTPGNPAGVTQWWQLTVTSDVENGLLSMAFHPDYPATPEVFVYYTDTAGSNLARMRLDDVNAPVNPIFDTLLTVPQNNGSHNGGDLVFDSSDYLYLSLGDDLDAGNAQRAINLYGSILRLSIPVYPATGYTIPGTNPFVGNSLCGPAGATGSDCPEIWAWGFRNPWRLSIDSGDLWVGDVGQGSREEVNRIDIGGVAANNNYGWPCFEGTLETSGISSVCLSPPSVPYLPPELEYSHSDGSSITGGYVYRGSYAGLDGRYVFGDFGNGKVWATTTIANDKEELLDLAGFISTFALGNDGEIYLADYFAGIIYRLLVPIEVAIDIEPAQVGNWIHTNHNSGAWNDVIQVGVLGSSTLTGGPVDFTPNDIDPSTVRFGPSLGALEPDWVPIFGLDFNSDGIYDANFSFLTGDSGITCGETSATLTGETTDGHLIEGTDSIQTQCNAQCH